MESYCVIRKPELCIALCGPLRGVEKRLLRRGGVEIIRDKAAKLTASILCGDIDCDMLLVQAPCGQGLPDMTWRTGAGKTCPVWLVNDPPGDNVWQEIERQLDSLLLKKQKAGAQSTMGPLWVKAVILAGDPQIRADLTAWTQEICAGWGLFLELSAPEDVNAYLRGLRDAPPTLAVVALPGVDALNTAEQLRGLSRDMGLVWCCDLDFSNQSYRLWADYFFTLADANRDMLEIGLCQWAKRIGCCKKRGILL